MHEGLDVLCEGARLDSLEDTHREEAGVEVQQRHEHEHQKHAAAQLHVLLRRALSHRRHAGKHALPFRARLGQQQQEPSTQSQIPAQTHTRLGVCARFECMQWSTRERCTIAFGVCVHEESLLCMHLCVEHLSV